MDIQTVLLEIWALACGCVPLSLSWSLHIFSLLVVLSNNWHDFHVGLSNSLLWRAEIQKQDYICTSWTPAGNS